MPESQQVILNRAAVAADGFEVGEIAQCCARVRKRGCRRAENVLFNQRAGKTVGDDNSAFAVSGSEAEHGKTTDRRRVRLHVQADGQSAGVPYFDFGSSNR